MRSGLLVAHPSDPLKPIRVGTLVGARVDQKRWVMIVDHDMSPTYVNRLDYHLH